MRRQKVYLETKDMTLEQYTERVRKIGEESAKKYGFHRAASMKVAQRGTFNA